MTATILEEIKDIEASVWISASAGTGKTKSLIDRILALLLNGVAPKKILCLTYTKAAATEMLTRLSEMFQKFSEMNDADLKLELQQMGFCEVKFEKIAKKLYEKSLIASDWVQIKTIHSFCFGVLQRFPLETGLMPGVSICSDYERNQLLLESVENVIFRDDCRDFSKFLARFTTDITDIFKGHMLKLQKFLAKFDDFKELYANFFGIKEDSRHLLLNETEDQRDERLISEAFNGKAKEIFGALAASLSSSKKRESQLKETLLNNSKHPSADFLNAFFTKDLKPRSGLNKKMQEGLAMAQEFLVKKNQYVSAEANVALFSLLRKIVEEFSELKRRKHCIDYDDIISMTSSLLNNLDWVMFKIDSSIDHLLIDEAQDTSPEQWDIICTITDEFFNNYGSIRTVFVVGDEKQSIYSFQGADVRIFQQMHTLFEARSKACGQRFHNVQLNKSYRTTGNILRFIDMVFEDTYLKTKHSTNRAEKAGIVNVVELFREGEDNNTEETSVKNTADQKLAQHIATFIKSTLDSKEIVESKGRPAKPEDFMILFQRRDKNAMYEIIKALRNLNIPVSGLDRIFLKDEMIVEDLITLAEFAVFPLDDLSCARVLKSPVVGISEETLMHLCLERGERSLWEYCLEKFAEKPDAFEKLNQIDELEAFDDLKSMVDKSLTYSAYSFFAQVLSSKMKAKFVQRLGNESLDSLADFMDVVVNYEKENTPSLQSFLEWFADFGEKIEIKKDAFAYSGCVRLMTVHASKGLQAPFVLLADAHFYNARSESILKTEEGILIWESATKKEWKNNAMKCDSFRKNNPNDLDKNIDAYTGNVVSILRIFSEYREASAEESLRELYVALTRAEDYVGILGKEQKNGAQNEKCWHKIGYETANRIK